VRPLLVLLALVVSTAHADPLIQAREHYRRGNTLYDLRRYLEAAKAYESAFEIKDDPVLLFNIGQAYRFGGDYENAIASYKAYLRRVPQAPNRSEVEGRISELQKLHEERKRSETKPPTERLPPPETRPPETKPPETKPPEKVVVEKPPEKPTPSNPHPGRAKIAAGAAVMGVGVAMIVVGGAFAALTQSEGDKITNAPAGSTFDYAVEQRALTNRNVAIAGFAVGGAALVAGTVVLVLGTRERSRAHALLAPAIGSGMVGVVAQGRF
jgi:tetratricopeptide (TPR) repeat protein